MNTDSKGQLTEKEIQRMNELQKALDHYVASSKSSEQIGREYERFVGYLCTQQGYYVDYNGITKGKADSGIDLIAQNPEHTLLIQCKCWSRSSLVREKYIDQLAGSRNHYSKQNNSAGNKLIAVLVTTTNVSEEGKEHARDNDIIVKERVFYQNNYPRIKAYLFHNGDDVEKEYRLPFDKDYDRDYPYTYFWTVFEAEMNEYTRRYHDIQVQETPKTPVRKESPSTIYRKASISNEEFQKLKNQTYTTYKPVPQPQPPAPTPQKKKPFWNPQKIIAGTAAAIMLLAFNDGSNHKQVEEALSRRNFVLAQEYMNKVIFAEHRYSDECDYIAAGILMEEGEYIQAFELFNSMEYDVPEEIISDLKQKIYAQGQRYYRANKEKNAKVNFSAIAGYKESNDYLTLIRAKEAYSTVKYKELVKLIGFEDANNIIVKSNLYVHDFLEGTWRTQNRSYYFKLDGDGSSSFNLPHRWYGNHYSIENGIYQTGKENDTSNKVFKFTIVNQNKISIYCYSNRKTYQLYRE